MLKHDPTIDYEGFIDTYNQQGKAEASRLARDRYSFSFEQMKRRVERLTDYRYDEATGEYRHHEVPMSQPEKFLSLEDLEKSKKMVPIPEPLPTNLEFDKLVMELIYDRGLELSRYVRINHGTRTVEIDKKALVQDGFQIVEK